MAQRDERQSEVDALLAAIAGMRVKDSDHPAAAKPEPYDFRDPHHATGEHLRGLARVYGEFSRGFGGAVSSLIHAPVEARVIRVDQARASELFGAMANPTSIGLLEVVGRHDGGRVGLEIPPRVIYPMLDRWLGARASQLHIPARAMTAVERKFIARVYECAAGAMTAAWGGVAAAEYRVAGIETDPRVAAASMEESAIVIVVEVATGGVTGALTFALPCRWVETVKHKLVTRDRAAPEAEGAERETIEGRLKGGAVEVRGFLARTTITVSDLLRMAPGDVVVTEQPADGAVVVTVEGREKFLARLGQSRGRLGLQIARRIE